VPGNPALVLTMVRLVPPTTLTPAEVETFLARGHVVIKGGIDRGLAQEWCDHSWARIGADPADPTTWGRPEEGARFLRLEPMQAVPLKECAPRVYGAICDLVGGAERLDVATLTDTMIMNLGSADKNSVDWTSPDELAQSGKGGWHKDGWHFKHFLDTPDQALLITVLFSDVVPGGGGTFIAADSPAHVARFLAANPQVTTGSTPKLGQTVSLRAVIHVYILMVDCSTAQPRRLQQDSTNGLRILRVCLPSTQGCGGDVAGKDDPRVPSEAIIAKCKDFVELTGEQVRHTHTLLWGGHSH
jgi:hypothetical protein